MNILANHRLFKREKSKSWQYTKCYHFGIFCWSTWNLNHTNKITFSICLLVLHNPVLIIHVQFSVFMYLYKGRVEAPYIPLFSVFELWWFEAAFGHDKERPHRMQVEHGWLKLGKLNSCNAHSPDITQLVVAALAFYGCHFGSHPIVWGNRVEKGLSITFIKISNWNSWVHITILLGRYNNIKELRLTKYGSKKHHDKYDTLKIALFPFIETAEAFTLSVSHILCYLKSCF